MNVIKQLSRETHVEIHLNNQENLISFTTLNKRSSLERRLQIASDRGWSVCIRDKERRLYIIDPNRCAIVSMTSNRSLFDVRVWQPASNNVSAILLKAKALYVTPAIKMMNNLGGIKGL